MAALKRQEIHEVFTDYLFAQSTSGQYRVPEGWYPVLGLPGSLDVKDHAVLFCKLQGPIEAEAQKSCLNGVIEKIRIHRSARVNGPDTMLLLASDLMHEFEVCQVPILSDVEQLAGILSPRGDSGPRLNTSLQDPLILQTGTNRNNGEDSHDQR